MTSGISIATLATQRAAALRKAELVERGFDPSRIEVVECELVVWNNHLRSPVRIDEAMQAGGSVWLVVARD